MADVTSPCVSRGGCVTAGRVVVNDALAHFVDERVGSVERRLWLWSRPRRSRPGVLEAGAQFDRSWRLCSVRLMVWR